MVVHVAITILVCCGKVSPVVSVLRGGLGMPIYDAASHVLLSLILYILPMHVNKISA